MCVAHWQVAKGKELQFGDLAELVAGARGRAAGVQREQKLRVRVCFLLTRRAAERNNDPEGGIWSAGQSVGLIDDIPTVDEFMRKFMAEAVATAQSVSSLVTSADASAVRSKL